MTGTSDNETMTEQVEPLQLDAQGVPILTDVVISGDQLAATGIVLPPPAGDGAARPGHRPDLEQRIQAAIDAALPKVTERTADAMRRALFKEMQDDLRDHRTHTDAPSELE
jgi:hypothetical protein